MTRVKTHGYIWGLVFNLICPLFILWQSVRFVIRYGKLNIWPWEFKVEVIAKVKPNSHIFCLEFNNSMICLLFIFEAIIQFLAKIKQIPYFALKIQGQGHKKINNNQVI